MTLAGKLISANLLITSKFNTYNMNNYTMKCYTEAKERFKQKVEASELSSYASTLANLAVPCIRITTSPEPDNNLAPGSSKFGGTPDLPEHFEWPYYKKNPLAFLAQINFADVASYNFDRMLPESGILSYFYELEAFSWGSNAEDIGSWKAYYFENSEKLVRTAPKINPNYPAQEHERKGLFNKVISNFFKGRSLLASQIIELPHKFNPCRLTFTPEISLPGYERKEFEQLKLTEDEFELYYELYDSIFSTYHGANWLLGYPQPVQNDDMELECHSALHNISITDRKVLFEQAADWLLLMQIDSDHNAKMMWGDAGILYLWIKKQDLLHKNFDNVWTILQCY